MNEDRILDKLDAIEARGVETLIEIAKLQEQIKDLPDLKQRVSALEKWRWTAMGALAAAGTSLTAQMFTVLRGA